MIAKYGLFNHHDKTSAFLSVLFDDIDDSLIPEQDDDVLIYTKNNNIVRIDIFRIAKFVKIKFKGLVVLPNSELIAIINGYLGKYGYMLANKNHSGFYFAKESDQYVIKVKKDTLTADGKFVRADRIATEYDLDAQENQEPLEVEKDYQQDAFIGQDIFQMEEKAL